MTRDLATRFRLRIFAFVAALACLPTIPAQAQSESTSTFTSSTTEQIILNPAQVSTTSTIGSYLTQIIGQLQGGSVLYDQSFALPYADPAVQAGRTAAMLAITTTGGPGVVIGTPVLTATSQSLSSSISVTTYTLVDTNTSVQSTVQVGPNSVETGPRTVCSGIPFVPSTTSPSCGPGASSTFTVIAGTVNINTNIDTAQTIDQDTLIAQTFQLFEQYTISDTTLPVGGAHAAIPSALGDENQRFTQRMLRAAGRTDGGASADIASSGLPLGWVDAYGWTGSGGGDHRDGAGLEGGLVVDVSEQLRLGFGVSQGRVGVSLDDGSGNAAADLTEFGVSAKWRSNDVYFNAAAIAGFGTVETDGLDSTGRYDANMFSMAGEAGRNLFVGDWRLTPYVGAQWTHITTGGFTETGRFALTSTGSSTGFGKGWLGLDVERQFEALTLSGHAQLMAYADDDVTVPVAFVGASTPLLIAGADRGPFGVEAGFSIDLHLSDAISAFGTYDLKVRDGSTSHTGMLGLRGTF